MTTLGGGDIRGFDRGQTSLASAHTDEQPRTRAWMAATLVFLAAAAATMPAQSPARGPAAREARAAFDPQMAAFAIKYGGETASYREQSTFVLPGATLRIEVVGPRGAYALRTSEGPETPGTRAWSWHAPQVPGVSDLRIEGPAGASASARDAIVLHVFVLVPASDVRNGVLNGYEIGSYPPIPRSGRATYEPPRGFIEVTRANQDVNVSPHFQLKQFLCKQETKRPFPQYLVLDERLVLALEAILARINQLGIPASTLHVMSGYRTPFYNHAIGDVLYSQHQWGRAADVYVDRDDRSRMDDLNRDGVIDVNDSTYLADVIEQVLVDPALARLQGGMGIYPAASAHPPFVHVDVRGSKARWRG